MNDAEILKALFAAALGAVSLAFWKIIGMIGDANKRIDRVREETVHKTDLDHHLNRLGDDIRELRSEHRLAQKDTQTRLDTILTAVAASKKDN